MASAADVLLGRILVRNRLVSKEQVDACLAEVSAQVAANGGLAEALVRHRLVPIDQIEKARHAAALLQARRYLKFGEELGFVAPEQADEALAAFRATGYGNSVAHVLKDKGWIVAAQNEAIINRDPMFLGDARSAFPEPAPHDARISTAGLPAAHDVGPSPGARKTGSFKVAFDSGPYQRPDLEGGPSDPTADPGAVAEEPRKRTQLQVAFEESPAPAEPVPVPAEAAPAEVAPAKEPVEATRTEPVPAESAPAEPVTSDAEPDQEANAGKRTTLQVAFDEADDEPEASVAAPPTTEAEPWSGTPGTGGDLSGSAREFVAILLRDGLIAPAELDYVIQRTPPNVRTDHRALIGALAQFQVLAISQAEQVEACMVLEREEPSFSVEGYYLVKPLGFDACGPVLGAQRTLRDGSVWPVALEIVPNAFQADARRSELFRRRAAALTAAEVPSLARPVDSGRALGCSYLAWALPFGQTLREKLVQEGPLDEATAAHIALGIAEALDALEAVGVVHGAVRPESILLIEGGHAILRYVGRTPCPDVLDPELPPPCSDLPWYAAPEQMLGDQIDVRTDLYGLGITLFEAVTGLPPYGGATSTQIIQQVLAGRLPDAKQAGAPISDRFSAMIRVLMASPPTDRYGTARELMHELASFGSGGTEDRTMVAGAGPASDDRGDEDMTIVGGIDAADLEEMKRAALQRKAMEAARRAGLQMPSDAEVVAADSEDPLIGAILSQRYRVLRKIGQGGMGAVYQAHHLMLNKVVALKVLHPRLLQHTESIRRFDREVKAASRFQDKHVVQIFDAGEDNGPDGKPRHYMVMEYVEGRTLTDVIQEAGELEFPRAMELFQQTLRAVAHAHQKGIIHRDMKSDNIMICKGVGDTELAKIMDFGIAKIIAGDDSGAQSGPGGQNSFKTRKGVVTGTPQYMSPEQASGDPNIDHRADIYSLGIILYEACMGEIPFKSNTAMGYLGKHIVEPPTPFEVMRPDIEMPEELGRVILKALEKQREDRYQSAEEMLADIEKTVLPALAGKRRKRRGRGPRKWLVAVLLLAIAGGAAFVAWKLTRGGAAATSGVALERAINVLGLDQPSDVQISAARRDLAPLVASGDAEAVEIDKRLQASAEKLAQGRQREELVAQGTAAMRAGRLQEAARLLEEAQAIESTTQVRAQLVDIEFEVKERQAEVLLGEGRDLVKALSYDDAYRRFERARETYATEQLFQAWENAKVGRASALALNTADEKLFPVYDDALDALRLRDPDRTRIKTKLADRVIEKHTDAAALLARAAVLFEAQRYRAAQAYYEAVRELPASDRPALDRRQLALAKKRAEDEDRFREIERLSELTAADPRKSAEGAEDVWKAADAYLKEFEEGAYRSEVETLQRRWYTGDDF